MKIISFIAGIIICSSALAETNREDCPWYEPVAGIIEVAEYGCEGEFCSLRVIAPAEFKSKKFFGFTLIHGNIIAPS